MHPPLRFAVVGCGMLAQSQHLPNIVRSKKAALETCVDIDDAALAACREKFRPKKTSKDYRAAIRDSEVDAICLATAGLRWPVIEAAVEARKPIYIEKPLGATLDEIYRIQRAVNQAGLRTCVGHNRRSSPAMEEAHRIFRQHMEHPQPCPWRFDREGARRPPQPDDGTAVMNVRINDDWHTWKGWALDPDQAPHGPILWEMTHFTDLCNWLLDARPREVFALDTGRVNTVAVIHYETGELATITMGGNGTFGYPKELYEMMGNGGFVAVDHMVEIRTAGITGAPARKTYPLVHDALPGVGLEGGLPGWLAKRAAGCEEAARSGDPMRQLTAEADKGRAQAIDRFVDEIRGEGPMVCGVDDAVLATRIAFAAITSVQERRIVALAEV